MGTSFQSIRWTLPQGSPTCARHVLITPRSSRFGAVLEEFEVRDALSSIFATKQEAASLQQTYNVLERFG
jgi:hypothetical protein